jgi:hypothetical protein
MHAGLVTERQEIAISRQTFVLPSPLVAQTLEIP